MTTEIKPLRRIIGRIDLPIDDLDLIDGETIQRWAWVTHELYECGHAYIKRFDSYGTASAKNRRCTGCLKNLPKAKEKLVDLRNRIIESGHDDRISLDHIAESLGDINFHLQHMMMHMDHILATIVIEQFKKDPGTWQSKQEHPRAFQATFCLKSNSDQQLDRNVHLLLYGHKNYVAVLFKESAKWEQVSIHDGSWSLIMYHDSGWKDAVARFVFERRYLLSGILSLHDGWYQTPELSPEEVAEIKRLIAIHDQQPTVTV